MPLATSHRARPTAPYGSTWRPSTIRGWWRWSSRPRWGSATPAPGGRRPSGRPWASTSPSAVDLDAARVVAVGRGVGAEEVLDGLRRRGEHSLLQVDATSATACYQLPETVRAHACDLLGKLEELRTAMDRALTLGRPLAVVAIAEAAFVLFTTRGQYAELRRRPNVWRLTTGWTPGETPWGCRSHIERGSSVGLFHGGQLVAMAGQRLLRRPHRPNAGTCGGRVRTRAPGRHRPDQPRLRGPPAGVNDPSTIAACAYGPIYLYF